MRKITHENYLPFIICVFLVRKILIKMFPDKTQNPRQISKITFVKWKNLILQIYDIEKHFIVL